MKKGLIIACTIIVLLVLCEVFLLNKNTDDNSANSIELNESDGPWNYQTSIEDIVRFEVALYNVVIDNYDKISFEYLWDLYIDRVADFEDYMYNVWKDETEEQAFQHILINISDMPDHEYYKLAKEVLKEYNQTNVILSSYSQIPTSSNIKLWVFRELNTGLDFKFTLGDTWFCEVDEDSAMRYLRKYMR